MVRIAVYLILGIWVGGCGPDESADNGAGFGVVMVMDMAGLGDKGFNDAGWAGV